MVIRRFNRPYLKSNMKKVGKTLMRIDVQLVIFFVYLLALGYLLLKGYGLLSVVYVHLFFVVIYGIICFREDLLIFLFSPILAVVTPVENYFTQRYLKNFEQNVRAKTVVILGRSDWFKLDAWLRHNFLKKELKLLVNLLQMNGGKFSFYIKAKYKDVEKIMADKTIKEVYFFGHGDSHVFQLNTEEVLYYCDFNDPNKYGKEHIHQIHCGDPDGKSLIDYVVLKENRAKCFFFRKPINSYDIQNELKRRIK